ncbi:MAG: ABC transporter substrate-binding protein [Candidatus Lambdaproteobacteria bacterium]|nr:ABC transporter substrate-binding protein [Candidatus Lambdaproteobacteria bacterium]
MTNRRIVTALMLGLLAAFAATSDAWAQKYGGTLVMLHRESPPSLSAHEEATISTVYVVMPTYNNLVLFDPLKARESLETIIPELATSWFWSDGGKRLTFRLRRGVKWHDGKPFTARDVKHTFDVAREVSKQHFKVNPRKEWWENIADVAAAGDHEVTFRLKRPQPSLVVMMASGYVPIYPAHVPPQALRTKIVGTGPFKLKTYEREKSVSLAKNPDYFVKGRPYLDGIDIPIIKARGTRDAALRAKQADVSFPYDITESIKRQTQEAAPQIIHDRNADTVSENMIVNMKKPPFNDAKLRRVVALAMDRTALIRGVHQGLGQPGGANLPLPHGVWGLPEEMLANVPGMGEGGAEKEKARQIMRELGYGPEKPLKVTMSTRAIVIFVDVAVWAIDQLKQVWIDATLEQVETGNWHPKVTRRDYQIATNLTGVGVDDPDANFFENYTCGSPRNYSDYCSPELEKRMVQQSMESDPQKRLKAVHEIDLQLQLDGARPILRHRIAYTSYWPYVKNYMNHQNTYNNYRMQEVWLDK